MLPEYCSSDSGAQQYCAQQYSAFAKIPYFDRHRMEITFLRVVTFAGRVLRGKLPNKINIHLQSGVMATLVVSAMHNAFFLNIEKAPLCAWSTLSLDLVNFQRRQVWQLNQVVRPDAQPFPNRYAHSDTPPCTCHIVTCSHPLSFNMHRRSAPECHQYKCRIIGNSENTKHMRAGPFRMNNASLCNVEAAFCGTSIYPRSARQVRMCLAHRTAVDPLINCCSWHECRFILQPAARRKRSDITSPDGPSRILDKPLLHAQHNARHEVPGSSNTQLRYRSALRSTALQFSLQSYPEHASACLSCTYRPTVFVPQSVHSSIMPTPESHSCTLIILKQNSRLRASPRPPL